MPADDRLQALGADDGPRVRHRHVLRVLHRRQVLVDLLRQAALRDLHQRVEAHDDQQGHAVARRDQGGRRDCEGQGQADQRAVQARLARDGDGDEGQAGRQPLALGEGEGDDGGEHHRAAEGVHDGAGVADALSGRDQVRGPHDRHERRPLGRREGGGNRGQWRQKLRRQ